MTVDDQVGQGVAASDGGQTAQTMLVEAQIMGQSIDTLHPGAWAVQGAVRLGGSPSLPDWG